MKKKSFFRGLFSSSKEKEFFIENLSMLVSSGMGISSSLESIDKEINSRNIKEKISYIKEEIENGSPFWRVLDEVKMFPARVVALVRIGEKSGRLADNLRLIAEQEQKDRVFRSKIKSAVIYPVIVFFLSVIIGLGTAWFVLPNLFSIFSRLDVEIPVITKILIGVANFFSTYGYIAVPSFLVFLIVTFYFIFVFSKTKFIGQAILFRMPVIKNLIKESEIARFGYLLGTLIETGLPIVEAIDSVYEAETFYTYKKFLFHLKNSVEKGNSFKKSFNSYPKLESIIPTSTQQVIFAGEQSGKLSETLLKVGNIFEEKTENTTKNLTVLLEPILLVVVWVGVLVVALAVIMPIYGLIGGL